VGAFINLSFRFDEETFFFFSALDITSGQFQFPHFSVKSAGSAVDTCLGQAVPCWFLNEPLLAAGLPQPQTKPIIILAALLQLQALNVSVSPPSTVKRTLFSGPAIANEIERGLESHSIPPWQNKDARLDHDGDPSFLLKGHQLQRLYGKGL
jgi:hypothetical protein